MTSRVQSQCTPTCARFVSPFSPANTVGVKSCAAFPAGIPERVWNNELDHRQPIDGDHGLRWEANPGYDFPTYAFAPEALGEGTVVAAGVTGELHTGAMIALIPTDPEALAVDGGEPADELHCTLLFLGEADKIDDARRAQILEVCRTVAAGWYELEAEAFSVAMFNPLGDEPCIVLGLSGVELAELHDDIESEVETDQDQHQPWVPHLTLAYTDDAMLVGDLLDRCGPVMFDRLRVAFGDQVTDIPLGDVVEDDFVPPDDDVTAEEVPPEEGEAPAIASGREVWDGCPRCFQAAHDGACVSATGLSGL